MVQIELLSILDDLEAAPIWGRMTWIEGRIEHYMERYPQRAAHIWDTFKYGKPVACSDAIWQVEELWQSHCNQLIERVAHNADITLATDAEIIIGFKEISLKIPLHGNPFNLYVKLFQRCLPQATAQADLGQFGEPWEGSTDDLYQEMQHKLRRKARPAPNPQRWIKMQAARDLDERSKQLDEDVYHVLAEAITLLQAKPPALPFQVGDSIWHTKLKRAGTVARLYNQGQSADIWADRDYIQVRACDLRLYKEAHSPPPSATERTISTWQRPARHEEKPAQIPLL